MSLTDQQFFELDQREAAPWAERAQALAGAQVERQLPLLGELARWGWRWRAPSSAPPGPGRRRTGRQGPSRQSSLLG